MTQLERCLEGIPSCPSKFLQDALVILSTVNAVPLLTQHLLQSILFRTNKAIQHAKYFHTVRRRIDRRRDSNPLKRGVWRYKMPKRKQLPQEAGLWEMGYISRQAVKGMRKMAKLVEKLVMNGEKVKKDSGKCAYWLLEMGVEQEKAVRMVFDPQTRQWRIYEPVVLDHEIQEDEGEWIEEYGSLRDGNQNAGDDSQEPSNGHVRLPSRLETGWNSTNENSKSTWGTSCVRDWNGEEGEEEVEEDNVCEDHVQPGPTEFLYTQLEPISEAEEGGGEKAVIKKGKDKITAPNTPVPKTEPRAPLPGTSTPPYEHSYLHPTPTDEEIATALHELDKALVHREHLWNPTPRLLDATSRKMCVDADRKVHIVAPTATQEQVIEKRKRDARQARERKDQEERERYKSETGAFQQFLDKMKEKKERLKRELRGEEVALAAQEVEEYKDEEVIDEKSAAFADTVARTRKFGRGDETEEQASQTQKPSSFSSHYSPTAARSLQESTSTLITPSPVVSGDGIYVHRSITHRRHRPVEGFVPTMNGEAHPSTTHRPPLRRKSGFENIKRLVHVGNGYKGPPLNHFKAIKNIVVRKGRRIFLRTRQRTRLFHHRSAEKVGFKPTKMHLKCLKRSMRQLMKRSAKLMEMYKIVTRQMDAWEPFVASGQAWSRGRKRPLPGFVEGTGSDGQG